MPELLLVLIHSPRIHSNLKNQIAETVATAFNRLLHGQHVCRNKEPPDFRGVPPVCCAAWLLARRCARPGQLSHHYGGHRRVDLPSIDAVVSPDPDF